MTFAVEVGRLKACSPQGYRPTHWELPTNNYLMHDGCRRLLVESEGFITLVCSFTIPKSTNVKPYPMFGTSVPASCFATQAFQETPTRESKRSILPSFTFSPRILSPFSPCLLWLHCNFTPLTTVPRVYATLAPGSYTLPAFLFTINSVNHTTFLT